METTKSYKIIIHSDSKPYLVEVPEKPVNTHDNPIEYSELWMKYQDALSAALADESKWIAFKDIENVWNFLFDEAGMEVVLDGNRKVKLMKRGFQSAVVKWPDGSEQLVDNKQVTFSIGKTFDLPENIGVSFEETCCRGEQFKYGELDSCGTEWCSGKNKLAILTPKPESVPSCGDGWISVKEQSPEVNQWVLGFIVEYDFEDRKVIGEDISVVSRNYEGDWFENAGDVIDYAEVTHWMPLPKAPTKP